VDIFNLDILHTPLYFDEYVPQLYKTNVIKEKITCIACSHNFYVVVTDNGEVYHWSLKIARKSSFRKGYYIEKSRKVIELSGKTIGNLFKLYYYKILL